MSFTFKDVSIVFFFPLLLRSCLFFDAVVCISVRFLKFFFFFFFALFQHAIKLQYDIHKLYNFRLGKLRA